MPRQVSVWDFHADALTSPGVDALTVFAIARSSSGAIRTNHRGNGMAATEGNLRPLPAATTWRTPLVILVCGCLIGMLTFGPRSTFGFFMQPMSREFSWGRDVFGLALAIQNLLWGIGQPIAGAIADRFGSLR
jgi:hypothetical protein